MVVEEDTKEAEGVMVVEEDTKDEEAMVVEEMVITFHNLLRDLIFFLRWTRRIWWRWWRWKESSHG